MTDEYADLIEQAARGSWALDDFQLDLAIATTLARRDVCAAHGQAPAAEVWNELLCRLVDARAERAQARRELDDPLLGYRWGDVS